MRIHQNTKIKLIIRAPPPTTSRSILNITKGVLQCSCRIALIILVYFFNQFRRQWHWFLRKPTGSFQYLMTWEDRVEIRVSRSCPFFFPTNPFEFLMPNLILFLNRASLLLPLPSCNIAFHLLRHVSTPGSHDSTSIHHHRLGTK
jgi:hypothetical protein